MFSSTLFVSLKKLKNIFTLLFGETSIGYDYESRYNMNVEWLIFSGHEQITNILYEEKNKTLSFFSHAIFTIVEYNMNVII